MRVLRLSCLILFLLTGQTVPAAFASRAIRPLTAAADEVKGAALLVDFDKASFVVRANVCYRNESEKTVPIANTGFYLLSRNLIETLKAEKFEFADDDDNATAKPASDEKYLTATALAFLPSDEEDAEWVEILITAAVAKHKLASFKTDKDGEALLKQIKPGDYFLFGIGRAGNRVFVWHTQIRIVPGKNKIKVDQHNAAVVFDAED